MIDWVELPRYWARDLLSLGPIAIRQEKTKKPDVWYLLHFSMFYAIPDRERVMAYLGFSIGVLGSDRFLLTLRNPLHTFKDEL